MELKIENPHCQYLFNPKRATKNRDFFQIPVCIHVFSSFKNIHTTVQTGGVIYWNMQTQMEQKVIQAKSEF